jgi:deoxyribose-phosphate aldolase
MSEYTVAEVARKIDHAVLKPVMTLSDLAQNAQMCIDRGVGNMCVRPCDVEQAADLLRGSGTNVSMVVGFPHGSTMPEVKAFETARGLERGAVEFDMVMNIGRFLSGEHEYVWRDIAGVVEAAKAGHALVKVIFETGFLTLDQIAEACRIARDAGADFVKTSTGFGEGQATPEVIDVMLKTVGGVMGVKASGGIRSWETAVGFLRQGCSRLGVGSTETVLDGGNAEGGY